MAATAPLEATLGSANVPPSYAGMVSRAIPFSSRPFGSGTWRELNTVVFKPQDCHLPPGQKSVKDLRSLVIGELESRDLLGSIECLQILKDRTVKILFSDAGTSQGFFKMKVSL